MNGKRESVQEHADKLVAQLTQEGKLSSAPDAAAAAAAGAVPTFSSGTAALDPNTGKPVVPAAATPTFTEGPGVAMPEGAPSAEPLGQESKPIVPSANGRQGEQPAPNTPPPEQQAGTAAAEAAAEAIADRFAEFEEFEFEDPDLNVKIPLRVPKAMAESAKRGYGRRAAQDRAVRYLGEARAVLEPLIADGRINRILPLLQRALEDPNYGEYVYQGYERATKGLPLIEQAAREAAAAGAAAVETPVPTFDPSVDPFMAEQMAPIVAPLMRELTELRGKVGTIDQQRQEAERQAQERARTDAQRNAELAAAHQDLTRMFPDSYRGTLDEDRALYQRVAKYANDSGYIQTYGLRSGMVFAGQQIAQMDRERQAATASPAAALIAQVNQDQLALAGRQAADASRRVGGGAPMNPAPPPPPVPPSTMLPNGKMKPVEQYMREMDSYLRAKQGAPA